MPSAKLDYNPSSTTPLHFPDILQTRSGLALIEIQGTIHIGSNPLTDSGLNLNSNDFEDDGDVDMNHQSSDPNSHKTRLNRLGQFEFSENSKDVTLIIGHHQRLRGKIVPLKNPVAVVKMLNKYSPSSSSKIDTSSSSSSSASSTFNLPVVEIIRQKILFNSRPEPIVF